MINVESVMWSSGILSVVEPCNIKVFNVDCAVGHVGRVGHIGHVDCSVMYLSYKR